MTTTEKLLDEACTDNILVTTGNHPVPGLKAVYLNLGNRVLMILNPTDKQAEMACLLAEELGHHKTAPRCRLTYKTIEDAKAEARARRWAHRRILPPDRILGALRAGIRERWELAEYLDVTEEFLDEALEDYESAGDVELYYDGEE